MRMRITDVLALLLLAAAPAVAQQSPGTGAPLPGKGMPPGMGAGTMGMGEGMPAPKKPAPGSLEDLLDKALRNNADIRAAEAKVREAEASLNRARHQVVAKVVGLRNEIDSAKRLLGHSEQLLKLVNELFRKGTASQQEVQTAMSAVEKQKAEVMRLETELQSVTGDWKNLLGVAFSPDGQRLFTGAMDGSIRIWDTRSGRQLDVDAFSGMIGRSTKGDVQAPMAERIRTALNTKVKIEQFREEAPLTEALAYLVQKAAIEVPFRPVGKFDNATAMLMKGDLPLGAWLQALEDSTPNVRFVVREYGILVTTKDRIPDGAMTVHEFWKHGEKPKSTVGPMGMGTAK